jgi:hypothetical protein
LSLKTIRGYICHCCDHKRLTRLQSIFSSMRHSARKLVVAGSSRRSYATKSHEASKLRNMALVAHIGLLLVLISHPLKPDVAIQILGKPP